MIEITHSLLFHASNVDVLSTYAMPVSEAGTKDTVVNKTDFSCLQTGLNLPHASCSVKLGHLG